MAVRVAVVSAGLLVLLTLLGWYVGVPHWRPSLVAGEAYAIDVSHHQHIIDWPAVAADGIGFAYIKATEGQGYVDPLFGQNWAASNEAGVMRGAYHYFTLCAPGARQAANFLRTAPPDPAALPPAVDLEAEGTCDRRPPVALVNAELADFLTAVESAWGRPVLVYARHSWTSLYPMAGGPLGARQDRPMWRTRFFFRPSQSWAVWQVHYFARIDGIDTAVDFDVVRPALLSGSS